MQARVNAGIRKKNLSSAFICEINLIGFKRHNSLLKTVYASTVRINNLILSYLFKGWQLRKGNQWLELSKSLFLKFSANGGVDYALKRCYSRETSESNTDFLWLHSRKLKLASFSDQSTMRFVSEGKKRPPVSRRINEKPTKCYKRRYT